MDFPFRIEFSFLGKGNNLADPFVFLDSFFTVGWEPDIVDLAEVLLFKVEVTGNPLALGIFFADVLLTGLFLDFVLLWEVVATDGFLVGFRMPFCLSSALILNFAWSLTLELLFGDDSFAFRFDLDFPIWGYVNRWTTCAAAIECRCNKKSKTFHDRLCV